MKFIPGLELSEMLYEDEIAPIMKQRFPGLPYAAATLGMCSEVLGLDDEVSMDHEWGPRVQLFLSQDDHSRYSAQIMKLLRELLPEQFKGYAMMWRKPEVDVHGTRETILYHVWISTVQDTLKNNFSGRIKSLPLQEIDWLRISEQHLLEFTSGKIYHDDTGELTQVRESLKYYPDNVLRFLLMNEWNMVGGDWFPIGRIGSHGDQLGLKIQTARITQHLMRIAFRVSRRYFHYKKWFGSLFKQLPIASALEPVLLDLSRVEDWRKLEEKLGQAASILLQQQNKLGIAPNTTLISKKVDDGRHHIKHDFWNIGNRLSAQIKPPLKTLMGNQVFWLHEKSLIFWNEEYGKMWPFLLRSSD